ncbi:MAG TPA: cytochrome c [Dongiaceae bacterium]|nr:cytochrome c [Dongiaceae bacterium]
MHFAASLRVWLTRFLHFVERCLNGLARWITGLYRALRGLWRALGPLWLRILLLLALIVGVTLHSVRDLLRPNLTQETIERVQYLNAGWTKIERQSFYFTPQGTELLGLEYRWLVNFELPWSTQLLASANNLRGWGFIVDPGQQADALNPGNLAVGLGRHLDPKDRHERLDIGCAACHTGELHYKGTALRVDGGQAMQSISTVKRGEFIVTLALSSLETLLNPFKWDRFATRIAGHDAAKRSALRSDLWAFIGNLKDFSFGAGALKWYPIEEGRGRTDAVGRIANVVFGYDLDVPDNYRVADAPASYPFLWNIWRFDWVQYTGFTNQAMARNVGEALGVMAPIELVDKNGQLLPPEELEQTVVDIDGLNCAEGLLRKLQPPRWPEAVLGEIDLTKAQAGKQLFADHCAHCHGPHRSQPYSWPVADKQYPEIRGQIAVNWRWDMAGDISMQDGMPVRKDWREQIWSLPWISVDVVGTDPQLANNYIDNRYDASKLVPGSKPVNAGNGLQLLLNSLVPKLYQDWCQRNPPTFERSNPPENPQLSELDLEWMKRCRQIPVLDGMNVPFRIINNRAYTSRPLHGVWATPPFLHNGSVPTIYHLLSPREERPVTFYVGNREYDPQRLGYRTERSTGSFRHDTRLTGNSSSGHQFTDVATQGRIGPLLTEAERYQLLEYLKVMGDPAFTEVLGDDSQRWDQAGATLPPDGHKASCHFSHLRHGVNVILGEPEDSLP